MLNTPEFLKPRLTTPVAVLGAGVSGRGVVALVERLGASATLHDERGGPGVVAEFRPAAAGRGLVVFSPGFPPSHEWVVAARAAGHVCLGEIDFASLFWRGSLVAVTGTNGKTTLTGFLAHALIAAGRDAYAVGNIGTSFAGLVAERAGGAPDSIAVCEVSSFQAETLRYFRADATLWTNFAEDHLDRHASMENYFLAKWRLFERSIGGGVFAGVSVAAAAARYGQRLPAGATVATDDPTGDLLLRGTVFAEPPQRENFLLAAAWWRAAGWREPVLYAAAQTFKLPMHRLACVAEISGVGWWDDSKATNFHATEAALERFGAPVHLIAGGKAKGGDLAGFVARIAPRVAAAYLVGETRSVLAALLGSAGVRHRVCGSLAEAVAEAAVGAKPGENVVLSPGFSSLDQFRSYAARGESFISLVNALGQVPSLR